MSKNLLICDLLELYGKLLTEKQSKLLELYYFEDLSLSEIAENEGGSRQGAMDVIKRAEKELLKIEELANAAVFDNVEFVTYYPEKEELENLKYRSKKELQGDIRIVEIKGVDMCACCAPHVRFAGEIGIIKMLARN